jgi:LPS export ABC transporter protein LptC
MKRTAYTSYPGTGPVRRRLVVLALGALTACARAPASPEAGCDAPEPRPPEVSGLVATTLVDTPDTPGRRGGYVLHADSGHATARRGSVALCGVELIVLDSLGVPAATITARTGEYRRAEAELVARGAVRVVLADGDRRLETEELHYLPGTDRVWSPTTTWFYRGRSAVRADSFTANRRFTEFTLYRARGTFAW